MSKSYWAPGIVKGVVRDSPLAIKFTNRDMGVVRLENKSEGVVFVALRDFAGELPENYVPVLPGKVMYLPYTYRTNCIKVKGGEIDFYDGVAFNVFSDKDVDIEYERIPDMAIVDSIDG